MFFISDTVPVGGFCNFSKQCTGNNNSEYAKTEDVHVQKSSHL